MLKLSNDAWKKYKINFLSKKVTPKLVVLHSCKMLEVLKKKLKKYYSRLFALIRSKKNGVWLPFKNKSVTRHFKF